MSAHYLKVQGDDTLLVDLGGYGVLLHLDGQKRFYDTEYVKIVYKGEEPRAIHLPADMIVSRFDGKRVKLPQADAVRIWRHQVR